MTLLESSVLQGSTGRDGLSGLATCNEIRLHMATACNSNSTICSAAPASELRRSSATEPINRSPLERETVHIHRNHKSVSSLPARLWHSSAPQVPEWFERSCEWPREPACPERQHDPPSGVTESRGKKKQGEWSQPKQHNWSGDICSMVLSDLGSPSLATQKSSALDLCLACYSGAKSYNCAISDSYCWMVQFVANPCWMVQFVANPKRLLSRTVHSDRLTIRMAAGCASLLSSLSSKRSPRSKRLQSVCVCVKYCEIRQGNRLGKGLERTGFAWSDFFMDARRLTHSSWEPPTMVCGFRS